MSLALFFDGKLLSGGGTAKAALIHLEGGSQLKVYLDMELTVSRRPAGRTLKHLFATRLKDLPVTAQDWARSTANAIQKKYHDEAPTEVYPRRGGLLPTHNHRGQVVNSRGAPIKNYQPRILEPIQVEKPPKTKTLNNGHVLHIVSNSTYNDKPGLEVGRRLSVVYKATGKKATHSLGTIKEFTLLP